jgi:hypothetical protein
VYAWLEWSKPLFGTFWYVPNTDGFFSERPIGFPINIARSVYFDGYQFLVYMPVFRASPDTELVMLKAGAYYLKRVPKNRFITAMALQLNWRIRDRRI